MQVSELVKEAGHLHKDSIVLACDILECSPWFDFVDLDIYDATDLEVRLGHFSTDRLEVRTSHGMHIILPPLPLSPPAFDPCRYEWCPTRSSCQQG